MTATLMTHCGAVQVHRRELDLIDAPPPTDTWFPVKHADVIDGVTRTLTAAGFEIAKQSFAVSHGNHRMFSTMDLSVPLHTGVSLAIGIRNSTDKTYGETSVMLDRDEISERQSIFGFFKNA